jgi:hypothetical protein
VCATGEGLGRICGGLRVSAKLALPAVTHLDLVLDSVSGSGPVDDKDVIPHLQCDVE